MTFQTREFDDAGREVRSIMTFDECSADFFYHMIMGAADHSDGLGPMASLPPPVPAKLSTGADQAAGATAGPSSPAKERPKSSGGVVSTDHQIMSTGGPNVQQYLQRPKSAPYLGGVGGAVHCSWCGGFCGHALELELEKDMPASIQRALDSTEFANVALSAPSVESILPGPKVGSASILGQWSTTVKGAEGRGSTTVCRGRS